MPTLLSCFLEVNLVFELETEAEPREPEREPETGTVPTTETL